MRNYGKELILDIHEVENIHLFNRKGLKKFFIKLCDLIDMNREDLHFWDYVGEEAEYRKAPIHLRGTSAIQFISTSNITIHTLDEMKRIYFNIFSCKDFNSKVVKRFCREYFKGKIVTSQTIKRK